MSAVRRTVRRSFDGQVTVSFPEREPVRMFVREADGSIGEKSLDLGDLAADLVRWGRDADPPPADGVEIGWLEAHDSTRFFVGGRRYPLLAGLELVAAGIVEAIRQALR